MIVRNTKQGYATLHFKDGVKSVVYKILAGETVNIPTLHSVDQVVNKFLFRHGHLTIVNTSIETPAPQVQEKTSSEVQKAKEQTEEYISDKNSEKNKNKKSSKNSSKKG